MFAHFQSPVIDFLLLAGNVETIVDARVTGYARRKMIAAAVDEAEADVVGYLPHTITVEPLFGYDIEYYHLDFLQKGVYYVVSPKIGYNKVANQINSPLTWTVDADSLAKCDFGAHNSQMATFMKVFLDERKRFHGQHGAGAKMDIMFGRFFEDDHPMMLLGPSSTINKDSYQLALQVLPHYWIHGLFWRGPSPRAEPGEEDSWYLEFLSNDKDFYSVVMMEDNDSKTDDFTNP